MNQLFSHFFIPYISYVLYFLGIGLFSGSLVHFGTDPNRYSIIGIIGVVVFFIGAYLQEVVVNKKDISKQILLFIASNLLLSVGIGFMSGGVQHFVDIAQYAPYYVSLGFVFSVIGYILKFGVTLHKKDVTNVYAGTLILAVVSFFILNAYAGTIPANTMNHHGNTTQHINMKADHNHAMTPITTEKQFLLEMIPHHIDAIDGSKSMLQSKNLAIQTIAQAITSAQNAEVMQMKAWLKEWYGINYDVSMSKYKPMMQSQYNDELDYIRDMKLHHEMAIAMAKEVLSITNNNELKTLANSIITTQTKEIQDFNLLLGTGPKKDNAVQIMPRGHGNGAHH